MSFKQSVFRGVAWTGVGRIAQRVIGSVTTIVLARLLVPDDFGLMGMALLVVGVLSLFRNLGFNAAIIQKRDIGPDQISGLFWVNVVFSGVLAGLLLIAAPVVASFFQRPRLARVLPVFCFALLFGMLEMVPMALMRKRLRFRALAIINACSVLIGSISGVLVAAMGLGVWALVAQYLTHRLVSCVAAMIAQTWNPVRRFTFRRIRGLTTFGLYLQGGTLVNHIARNADDALIGKCYGAGPLAVYQMAYRLMLWPLVQVSGVVGEVMFPSLVSIKDDKVALKRAYLKAVACLSLVTFPMVAGAWIIAPTFIPFALGEKWLEVVPLFRILCPLGIPQSIVTTVGLVFLTTGRMDVQFRLVLFNSLIVVLSFVLGIRWGALGVAWCYACAHVVCMPVALFVAGRLINAGLGDYGRAVAGSSACSLLMGVAVWAVPWVLPAFLPVAGRLTIQFLLGVGAYVGCLRVFRVAAFEEVKEMLTRTVRKVEHQPC